MNSDTIFAGGYGGVYLTTDGGLKWKLLNNGFVSDTLNSSYTNPLPFGYSISSGTVAENGDLIVGTDSAGVFRSVDKGKTWMQTNLTVPLITSIVQDSLGNLFAGSLNNGVFESANNGLSWTQTTEILINGRKVYTLAGHKALVPRGGTDSTHMLTENFCFAGTDWGIYRYIIGDNSWGPMGLDNIITIEPLKSRDVVAGTPDGAIYLSSGGWNEWKFRGNVGAQVKVIVADSSDNLYAAGPDGLFKSIDKGETWTKKDSGLTDTYLTSAATDKKGNIFVGSQNGYIYKSSDQGEIWIQKAELSYPIRYILVEPDDEDIYAAVAGRLFDIKNPSVTGVKTPKASVRNFLLFQNFPNPFNPETVIRYRLSYCSFVTIKVYDMLGREVKTLINDYKAAGNYSVTFNGSNLPSGIYFYRMQAGSYASTKKLVLLK